MNYNHEYYLWHQDRLKTEATATYDGLITQIGAAKQAKEAELREAITEAARALGIPVIFNF